MSVTHGKTGSQVEDLRGIENPDHQQRNDTCSPEGGVQIAVGDVEVDPSRALAY
jgi:hypothetical protein